MLKILINSLPTALLSLKGLLVHPLPRLPQRNAVIVARSATLPSQRNASLPHSHLLASSAAHTIHAVDQGHPAESIIQGQDQSPEVTRKEAESLDHALAKGKGLEMVFRVNMIYTLGIIHICTCIL